jgi:hypothetical protein
MENVSTDLKNTFVEKHVSQPFCHATVSVDQTAFKTVLAIVNQIGIKMKTKLGCVTKNVKTGLFLAMECAFLSHSR